MALRIALGGASETGRRERNEDFFGAVTPEKELLSSKGYVAAIADGVSGHAGGREAAEYTVRNLLADYYATPETWSVAHSIEKLLTAANRWLLAQGASRRELSGMATTLSLLVFRGNHYALAHVGDTRIYRLRGESLQLLTTDHVWERPDMRHVLKRAVGLDQHLAIDFGEGVLHRGDVFLQVTDGVWEALSQKTMHEILYLHQDPQRAARVLVEKALAENSQDNVTAQVIRIEGVGEENFRDLLAEEASLAPPAKLKPRDVIDGLEVIEKLHDSRETLLYKVRDKASMRHFVLKTLQPSCARDPNLCNALLVEEWMGKKVLSHYFPQIIALSSGKRHYLYYLMTYHEGETLGQSLDNGRYFTVAEAVLIGIRLAKGLGALHRLNIVHRDIKPENVHRDVEGKLRILDLGVALNPGLNEAQSDNPGTPSFMAPELFSGESASFRSDIYAVGVTLYHLLTRKYPYGEIEPFQHPRFGEAVAPTRYRPDIPQWLEAVILKAVSCDAKERFETAADLLQALETGEHSPLMPVGSAASSGPFWPLALSLLLNAVLIIALAWAA